MDKNWHEFCIHYGMAKSILPEELRAPDVFVAPMSAVTPAEAMEELLNALCDADRLQKKPAALTGNGGDAEVAVLHAQVPGFDHLAFALGLCPQGIVFNQRRKRSVKAVFLSVWGLKSKEIHALLVSGLGRALANPSFRELLLAAKTPEDAMACFPSASFGRYKLVFRNLCPPLVPDVVYVTG